VRTEAAPDRAAIGRALQAALSTAGIRSAAEFAAMTAHYWLLTTGAGAALVLGAVLGVVVGVIVVAQTLYAAMVERLGEFATLRAIGASNSYLNTIVVTQALIGGTIGYVLGMAVSVGLVKAAANSTISLQFPWQLAAAVGAITLIMCSAASLAAIHRIKTIDPAMVFR
jgi:putative ABC transport system permease protein